MSSSGNSPDELNGFSAETLRARAKSYREAAASTVAYPETSARLLEVAKFYERVALSREIEVRQPVFRPK